MKAIFVKRPNLPAAWETAVDQCYRHGVEISTQYDRPGDPPSRDCTMLIRVVNPFNEPRYHRGLCMGLCDLEKYVQEVIYGVHDHWMDDVTNPNRWSYTYHQRLFRYPDEIKPSRLVTSRSFINQFAQVAEQLKQCPYTQRAQMVTWQVATDPGHNDPPCLQSAWFRVLDNKLHMNVRFRSNDLFKAAFPNMIALSELQKLMAEEVGVEVGEYLHLSDSMHIYGKDNKEVESFFSLIQKRTFERRTWTAKEAAALFAEGCVQLEEESHMPDDKKPLIAKRKKYWSDLSNI